MFASVACNSYNGEQQPVTASNHQPPIPVQVPHVEFYIYSTPPGTRHIYGHVWNSYWGLRWFYLVDAQPPPPIPPPPIPQPMPQPMSQPTSQPPSNVARDGGLSQAAPSSLGSISRAFGAAEPKPEPHRYWIVDATSGVRKVIEVFRNEWPKVARASVKTAEKIAGQLEQARHSQDFDATAKVLAKEMKTHGLDLRTTSQLQAIMERGQLCLVEGHMPPGANQACVNEGVKNPALPDRSMFCITRNILGLMSKKPPGNSRKKTAVPMQPPAGFTDADSLHFNTLITEEEWNALINDIAQGSTVKKKGASQNRERKVNFGVYYKLVPISEESNQATEDSTTSATGPADGGGGGNGSGEGGGGKNASQDRRPSTDDSDQKRQRTQGSGHDDAVVADFMDSVVEVVEDHLAGQHDVAQLVEALEECAREYLPEEWLNHQTTVQGIIAPAMHRWIDTVASWEGEDEDEDEDETDAQLYQRVADLHSAVSQWRPFADCSADSVNLRTPAPGPVPVPHSAGPNFTPGPGLPLTYPSFGAAAPTGPVADAPSNVEKARAVNWRAWWPYPPHLLLVAVAFLVFAIFGNYMFFAPVRDRFIEGFKNTAARVIQGTDARLAASKVHRVVSPLQNQLDSYLLGSANATMLPKHAREQARANVGKAWYEVEGVALSSSNLTVLDTVWFLVRPVVTAIAHADVTGLAAEAEKSTHNEIYEIVEVRLKGVLPPEKVHGELEDLLQAKILAATGPLKYQQLLYKFHERRCTELLADPDGLAAEVNNAIAADIGTLSHKYRLHPAQDVLRGVINSTVHAQYADFCPRNPAQTPASIIIGHGEDNNGDDDGSGHKIPGSDVSDDRSPGGSGSECLLDEAPMSVHPNNDPSNTERSRSLLLARAKTVVEDSVAQLSHMFAAVVHDPYHPSSIRSAAKLNEWPQEWIEATMGKIERGGADEAVWDEVRSFVENGVLDGFQSIKRRIEDREGEIISQEQAAYNQARMVMPTARTSLQLNGNPATVDKELTSALRGAIQTFRTAAVVHKVTPSPSYAKKLQRLKDDAGTQWSSAHDANYAAHTTKRQELQAAPVGDVTERIYEDVRACSNSRHELKIELASRLPQYFVQDARANLLRVRSRFEGSGGGEGCLNLTPGAGETLVSSRRIGEVKYNGNHVYYNPDNAVLRVVLEGGGWGGGVCTNPLWMSFVDFTITRNALALPENAIYHQPYVKGEAPVF